MNILTLKKKHLLKKYERHIKKFISKVDLGLPSKEGLYFLVARWLEIRESNNTMIHVFKNAGHQILTRRSNQEKENELDEKKLKIIKNTIISKPY
jgi:hypothetical protein